jgi:hypothetical protein
LQRLLRARVIQAKLTVNQPGDKYEQEADRVADQVMRMPDTTLNKKAPRLPTIPLIRRKVAENSTGAGEAPPIVHDVLASSGHPLDAPTRAFFEPRFGHDFSQVRVHVDSDAAESALAVHAHAYTVGSDIVFGAGQFEPGTREGQQLIAHELSHVVQPKRQDLRQKAMQQDVDLADIEPPVDCTKEITTEYNCLDLINEMSRHGSYIRDNDSWIKRYDSGELPFDLDAYVARQLYKIELQTKYNEKERVRTACCASYEVPGEPPTGVSTPAPQPTEPKTPSDNK